MLPSWEWPPGESVQFLVKDRRRAAFPPCSAATNQCQVAKGRIGVRARAHSAFPQLVVRACACFLDKGLRHGECPSHSKDELALFAAAATGTASAEVTTAAVQN